MNPCSMKLKFLGTGAADHCWDRYGDPDVRGSCQTLVDDSILIDAGATGRESLERFNIDPGSLTDLIITHSHSDHFRPEAVREIAEARKGQTPLVVHAAPEVLLRLDCRYVPHLLEPGDIFEARGVTFTALPANHQCEDAREQPFHYLIEKDGRTVLYALDGAWLTTGERKLIGSRKLDLIVWDATVAESGDWRSFEHNDLGMIDMMTAALRNTGTIDGDTWTVLNHMARTLWPEGRAAEELAAAHGHILAYDGMEIYFP